MTLVSILCVFSLQFYDSPLSSQVSRGRFASSLGSVMMPTSGWGGIASVRNNSVGSAKLVNGVGVIIKRHVAPSGYSNSGG